MLCSRLPQDPEGVRPAYHRQELRGPDHHGAGRIRGQQAGGAHSHREVCRRVCGRNRG